jgi:hypothetical protein
MRGGMRQNTSLNAGEHCDAGLLGHVNLLLCRGERRDTGARGSAVNSTRSQAKGCHTLEYPDFCRFKVYGRALTTLSRGKGQLALAFDTSDI